MFDRSFTRPSAIGRGTILAKFDTELEVMYLD